MKIGIWTAYGAANSKNVFQAFKQGASRLGFETVENKHGDIDVIWSVLWHGKMRQNKHIFDKAITANKPVIVLEIGAIHRGTTWKLALNGINNKGYFGPKNNTNDRAKKLRLDLFPWKKNNNGPIIIACQHKLSEQWKGMQSTEEWLNSVIKKIKKRTDKKIVVRPHPRSPIDIRQIYHNDIQFNKPNKLPGSYDDFDFRIEHAHALVNWSSNPGTLAAIKGIPVFTGPDSLAWEVANKDFKSIENPLTPDRQQWLNDLAYTEWTIQEIATGYPIERLTLHI